jgi:UDP-N-acetylmuramoylalanine--D-glutamate ligase
VNDDIAGARVLVLGLGDTGLSLVRHLVQRGACVRVSDTRPAPPGALRLARDFPQVGTAFAVAMDAAWPDVVAASPGVPTRAPAALPEVLALRARGVRVVGDFELFGQAIARLPRSERPAMIGVTGTNGKSTVTAMVGAMSTAGGLRTVVAGNIGLPILDALDAAQSQGLPQVFALELSSYQLETTDHLPLDTATCLNLSQDHLDRYQSGADYAAAKARIFRNAALAVVNRDDPGAIAATPAHLPRRDFGLQAMAGDDHWGLARDSDQIWLCQGERRLMPFGEVPITGLHNAANALAACALTEGLPGSVHDRLEGLRTFTPLPHRLTRVATVDGVTFYDDSKGTNVGATLAALQGSLRPVVLIAGGDGKGQDFTPLKDAVRRHARAVVLLGRDAVRIASALADTGVRIERAGSMAEAVLAAFECAAHGDHVYLSPACASFDMFRNYHHRGETFAECVRALAHERGLQP